MPDEICPFCGRDPFHYVDIGVGWEPVAVVCCEANIERYENWRRLVEEPLTTAQHGSDQ